jgi:AraC-like DNA-binding protein
MQQIPTHNLQDANPLEFSIERLNHVNQYNPAKVHRHDYFEIFLFESGSGQHLLDFEPSPIRPHQIHFVSPGQVHQIRRSTDSTGYVLLFSEAFYYFNRERNDFLLNLPFFYQKTVNGVVELPEQEFGKCLELVLQMNQIFNGRNAHKKSMLQSYLNIFLCQCLEFVDMKKELQQPNSTSRRLFHQFQDLLEKEYKSIHEVADYAGKLHVAPRQLNEVTQKHAGVSAVEFIHRRKALEAKRLLVFSPSNISEIGFALGFEDPSHFSRFVKKNTGKTPTQWRDKNGHLD